MDSHRKTTSQFIAEAQNVHGDKYDYSEVEYVNTHTPVMIKCRRCCVVFLQSPANHLVGAGLSEVQQETDAQAGQSGNVYRQSQGGTWR